LLEDVARLDERVKKLQAHFSQADGDLKNILISTEKIMNRSERIKNVELSQDTIAPLLPGN
jgi:DNA recombination protein RmuC